MDHRLQAFGLGIWTCEGPDVPFLPGFPYPTRMVIVRLADDGLFVWSPIALDADLRAEVDALGPVRDLVAPNRIHHLSLGEWRAAWPEARLHAAPGLARKRRDLAFDTELGDTPDPAWAGDLDQVLVAGSVFMSEVVFFHRASQTAIFADLIENFAPDHFTGWRGRLARLDGIVAPDPGAPREWRWSFLDRDRARSALDRILAWPIDRVVMAHGTMIVSDGSAFVRKAFGWLAKDTGK